jgi:hypothetical protein
MLARTIGGEFVSQGGTHQTAKRVWDGSAPDRCVSGR